MESSQLEFLKNNNPYDYLAQIQLLKSSKLTNDEFMDLYYAYSQIDSDLINHLCTTQDQVLYNLPEQMVIDIATDFDDKHMDARNIILLNNKNIKPSNKWNGVFYRIPLPLFARLQSENYSYMSRLISLTKIDTDNIGGPESLVNSIKEYIGTMFSLNDNFCMPVMGAISKSMPDVERLIEKYDCKDYVRKEIVDFIEKIADEDYVDLITEKKDRLTPIQLVPALVGTVLEQEDADKLICSQVLSLTDRIEEFPDNFYFVKKYKQFVSADEKFVELIDKAKKGTITHDEVLEFALINEKNFMTMAIDRFLNEPLGELLTPLNKGICEGILFGDFKDEEKQRFVDSIITYTDDNSKYGKGSSCYIFNKSFVQSFIGYTVFKDYGTYPPIRVLDNGIAGEPTTNAMYKFPRYISGKTNLNMPSDYFTFLLDRIPNLACTGYHESKHYKQFHDFKEEDQASHASVVSRMANNIRYELAVQYPELRNVADLHAEYASSLIEFEAYHTGLAEYQAMLTRQGKDPKTIFKCVDNYLKQYKISSLPNHYNATYNMLLDDVALVRDVVQGYSANMDNKNLEYLFDQSMAPFVRSVEDVEVLLQSTEDFMYSGKMNEKYTKEFLEPQAELESKCEGIFPEGYTWHLVDGYMPGNEMFENATKAYDAYRDKLNDYKVDISTRVME